jgi:hypothetical protein
VSRAEVAHRPSLDVVEALVDGHTQVGGFLSSKCALVAPVAQDLAGDFAAGGVLARLNGAARGLGHFGGGPDGDASRGAHTALRA